MIYFLKAEGIDKIKIGHVKGDCSSRILRKRMLELRGGCPVPIACVGMMEGDLVDERAIHRKYRQIHSHCEWFYASSELMTFIKENTVPYDGAPFVDRTLCWKRGE
jgi:hypothetical protein